MIITIFVILIRKLMRWDMVIAGGIVRKNCKLPCYTPMYDNYR